MNKFNIQQKATNGNTPKVLNFPQPENKAINGGFTMLFDSIVEEFGLTTAAVFGVIWRYCQMEGHRCTASYRTIGKRVGLHHQTVRVHAKKLVDAGYLRVKALAGVGNIYYDTGKISNPELTEPPTVFNSGLSDGETPNDQTTHCLNNEPTVFNSGLSDTRCLNDGEPTAFNSTKILLKKQLNKETIKETVVDAAFSAAKNEKPKNQDPQKMALAISKVTGLDVNDRELQEAANEMACGEYGVEDIVKFAVLWKNDARFKLDGKLPTLPQLQNEIIRVNFTDETA